MILAVVLLASAVVDTVSVAPGKSVLLPIEVSHAPAAVACEFTLMSAGPGVRVSLVTHDAARPHRRGVLASTGYAQKGAWRFDARPGRYAVLVENGLDNQHGAEVFVRVALLPPSAAPYPRELSPARRAVVVSASLLLFGLIAGYAFTRLHPSLARRNGQPPPV